MTTKKMNNFITVKEIESKKKEIESVVTNKSK